MLGKFLVVSLFPLMAFAEGLSYGFLYLDPPAEQAVEEVKALIDEHCLEDEIVENVEKLESCKESQYASKEWSLRVFSKPDSNQEPIARISVHSVPGKTSYGKIKLKNGTEKDLVPHWGERIYPDPFGPEWKQPFYFVATAENGDWTRLILPGVKEAWVNIKMDWGVVASRFELSVGQKYLYRGFPVEIGEIKEAGKGEKKKIKLVALWEIYNKLPENFPHKKNLEIDQEKWVNMDELIENDEFLLHFFEVGIDPETAQDGDYGC